MVLSVQKMAESSFSEFCQTIKNTVFGLIYLFRKKKKWVCSIVYSGKDLGRKSQFYVILRRPNYKKVVSIQNRNPPGKMKNPQVHKRASQVSKQKIIWEEWYCFIFSHFSLKLVRRKLNPHLCFGRQSVKCVVLVEL